jgi:hypothetical protein
MRFVVRMIVFLLLMLPAVCQAQLNIQEFRTTNAYPGSVVYLWFPEGGAPTFPSTPTGWTYFEPASYGTGDVWHRQWAWGVRIPTDATAGSYVIPVGSDSVNVTVGSAPAATVWRRILPGNEAIEFSEAALEAGFGVELPSTVHEWARPLECPAGAKIRGYGATVRRVAGGSSPYALFRPAGALYLEGLTLQHADELAQSSIQYIRKADGWSAGHVTVTRCLIQRGQLSVDADLAHMLVEGCKFDKGLVGACSFGAVFRDNEFWGPTLPSHHSFLNTGATSLLACSNRFFNTSRGMVFQTGDCKETVVMDTQFNGIVGGEPNANECILLEASPDVAPVGEQGMRRIVFVDTFLNNCAGPGFSMVGNGMHHVYIYNCKGLVNQAGININVLNGGAMDDLTIQEYETNGFVRFTGAVGDVFFTNLQIVERTLGAGNAAVYDTTLLNANIDYPFQVDDAAFENGTYWFTTTKYNSRRGQEAITAIDFSPEDDDFTPAKLPNLQLWLRADQGLTKAGGGTPADGEAIERWQSIEGSSLNFDQATGSKQPVLRSTGVGSQAAIDFDGSNDLLVHSAAALTATAGSLFVVVRFDALPNANGILLSTADTAGAGHFAWYGHGDDSNKHALFQLYEDPTVDTLDGDDTLAIDTNYLLMWGSDDDLIRVRRNGDRQTLTADTGSNTGRWYGDVTLRDVVALGGLKINSELGFVSAKIAEVISYSSQLTPSQVKRVQTYVASRYGISM